MARPKKKIEKTEETEITLLSRLIEGAGPFREKLFKDKFSSYTDDELKKLIQNVLTEIVQGRIKL